MKTTPKTTEFRSLRRSIALCVTLASTLVASDAKAQFYYWDPEGAVSAPSTTQLTGTWTQTGGTNWSLSSSGGSGTAWSSGTNAVFCSGTTAPGGSFLVTVSGTVTVGGIFNGPENPPGFNVILTNGTLSFSSGADAVCAGGSDGDATTIYSTIAGSGAQIVIEGTAPTALYGVNTYGGGTQLGFGSSYPSYFNDVLYFNNAASFGTGTITLTKYGTGAAIVASGTGAINIPNAVTLASSTTNNFVGNAAGVTYSGPWSLGANTFVFETGNTAGIIDIIAGPISGTAGWSVSDVGTLILTATNTFTGNLTNLSPNVLVIGGAGELGSGTFANNIVNSGFFTYGSSSTQTLSGIISGAGTNTQTNGTLILSGANTFTKGFTLTGGTLDINNNAALGTAAGTFTISGGTIDNTSSGTVTTANLSNAWNGNFAFTGTHNLNLGTGGVSLSASRTVTVNGSTLTVGGPISGGFNLTKAGAGTLSLNGTNIYTGGTTVSAGTLTVGGAGELGSSGSYAGAITNNSTLNFATSSSQTLTGIIYGTGSLTQSGPGTLTLNDDNTYTGSTTISGGVVALGTFATPFGAANGMINLAGGTIQVTLNRGTTGTENILNPVKIASISQLEAAPTTGTRFITFGGPVTSTGGTLIISNNASSLNGQIFAVVFTNSVIVATPVILTNEVAGNLAQLDVWNFSSVGDQIYNGVISGSGSIFRAAEAAGTGARVIFNAANTYTGGTSNNDGEIACGISSTGPADIPVNGPLGTGSLTIGGGFAQISAYGGAQVVGNHVVVAASPFSFVGTNSLTMTGNFDFGGATRTLTVLNTNLTELGGSILNGGLVVAGGQTLTLTNTNGYSGGTVVSNSSTLLLTSTAAISNSSSISILPGSTLDVSAFATYNLSSSTTLSATGSSSSAANLNGPSSGTVNLGSQAITLTFTPTSFNGDSSHPALVIPNGTLTLNSNTITVTNAGASPLAEGTYTLAQVTGGVINGTPNATATVGGTGLVTGATAAITVSGGTIYLVVTETPVFSNLAASPSITYGTAGITLSGTLSAVGPIYPASGETVTITVNGSAETTMIMDSMGDFSLTYTNTPLLAVAGSPYTISYGYEGDSSLNGDTNSSTTLTIIPAPLTVTASPQIKTYGQTVAFGPGSTLFTASTLSNGETIGTVTLTCSGGASNAPVSGSPYAITPSAATGGSGTEANYSITYVPGTLTISPLTVLLTGTEAYNGTSNAVGTNLQVANALGGDDVNVASGTALMSAEDIGTNTLLVFTNLVLGGVTGPNYTLAGASGSVIVTPLPVDLTGTRPYDGTNDASATILTIATNYDGTNLTVSGSGLLAGAAAGSEAITNFSGYALGGTAATNYTLTNATGSVSITPLTPGFSGLTASQSIVYGTPSIALAGMVSAPGPFYPVLGESISVTIGMETETTVTSDTNGDFALTFTNTGVLPVSGSPYTITYAYGGDGGLTNASDSSTELTVTPLPVVLTGTEPYDGSPSADYTYLTINNAINGDIVTLTSGSATLASANAGAEPITSAGTLTLGGANAGNYTLTGAGGTVAVGAVPLTVTANPQTTTYGTLIALVGSTQFGSSGLQPGDTIGSVTLSVSGYASNTPVGSYIITPSAATGGTFSTNNYTISYMTNTLTIIPLPVILDGTEAYDGTTNVAASVLSVPNALGGDDVSVASGTAVMASAETGTNALVVLTNLTLGGTSASNYTIVGASGAVIVTPLPVDLTGTRPYDGTNDASATILTIVTNYDGANLTLSGSGTLAGSAAGLQAITNFGGLSLGGTAASNYTLAGAVGSVTITPVAASFSALAASPTITYGAATVTLSGTVSAAGPLYPPSGETVSVTINGNTQTTTISDSTGDFSLNYGSSTIPASGSPYAISYGYAGDTSFTGVTNAATELTVDPLAVVLGGTRAYDGTATALSSILSVNNAINSDIVTVASGSATLASSAVGTEAITSAGTLALGGANAGNYTLVGATGSVVITNPYNPFAITCSTLVGTNLVICWQSVPGVVYNVLTNTDLTTTNWTASGTAVTASNTTTCVTLPGGVASSNVFIQIQQ